MNGGDEEQVQQSCLFCRLVAGSIPAEVVYSDEQTVAFRDINPQAPTHILVIPRRHVPDALAAAGAGVWEPVMSTAARLAREAGHEQGGYRLVVNSGPDADQSVFHLHVHVLGGRTLAWPPG